jgi:hypothetical protein
MWHRGHQAVHDEAGLADHGVLVSASLQAVRSLPRTRTRARCKATSGQLRRPSERGGMPSALN